MSSTTTHTPARRRRPPRPGAPTLTPLSILRLIALLQTAHYTTLTILTTFTALTAGLPLSAQYTLGWSHLRPDITTGWMWALILLLTGLANAVFVILLVARSKLVLDFGATIYAVHLCVAAAWEGVPRAMFWWACVGSSAAVTVGVAGWGCRWRELQPINFGGGGGDSRAADEGAGFEMGGARGNARHYEVVANGDAR